MSAPASAMTVSPFIHFSTAKLAFGIAVKVTVLPASTVRGLTFVSVPPSAFALSVPFPPSTLKATAKDPGGMGVPPPPPELPPPEPEPEPLEQLVKTNAAPNSKTHAIIGMLFKRALPSSPLPSSSIQMYSGHLVYAHHKSPLRRDNRDFLLIIPYFADFNNALILPSYC